MRGSRRGLKATHPQSQADEGVGLASIGPGLIQKTFKLRPGSLMTSFVSLSLNLASNPTYAQTMRLAVESHSSYKHFDCSKKALPYLHSRERKHQPAMTKAFLIVIYLNS